MSKKKIYICHSGKHDYINKLYNPIKNSKLMETYDFIFPHDGEIVNSKEIISSVDLVLVDISYASFGQGIELGWADFAGVDFLCVYEKGVRIGKSIGLLTDRLIEYSDSDELIMKLSEYL